MDNKKEELINIVYICDDNYAIPTAVSISSLIKNKHDNINYNINIICSNLSEQNLNILENLESDFVKINLIVEKNIKKYKKLTIKNFHVSEAALYKFDLANLLDCDKVIYIDGDTLIKKDLSELYSVDIENKYAAVIKDYKPLTYSPSHLEFLKINHNAYFNSGIMLLNLKLIREEDLYSKLLDYRINGINKFMDQDTLNVVFKENVVYLNLKYNVMTSIVSYFKLNEINEYYELNYKNIEDLYNDANILHLCTKFKPWIYHNVPFADEWKEYYDYILPDVNLDRKKLDIDNIDTFKELNNKNELSYIGDKILSNPIIVSLTSFPFRIPDIHNTIESILNQTMVPNLILLWLSEEQFPNKEKDLPQDLLNLVSSIFEIRWCKEDLKPHKKYFYTMQEFPKSIVITIDDDVIYDENVIKQLYNSYLCFPYAISCNKAHLILKDEHNNISPYINWNENINIHNIPSLALIAVGVGGVLYPPGLLPKETFNIEDIKNTCLKADDLWLKVMQIRNFVPVVLTPSYNEGLEFNGETQNVTLWKENKLNGENDIQLNKILSIYNDIENTNETVVDRIFRGASLFQLQKIMNERPKEKKIRLRKKIRIIIKNLKISIRNDGFFATIRKVNKKILKKLKVVK